jgi:hypothetical protein
MEKKMKKVFLLIIISVLMLIATGCMIPFNCERGNGNTKIYELKISSVKGIDLNVTGDVFITKGTEQSITIETDENIYPLLIAQNRNSLLNVENYNSICPTKLIIRMTLPEINKVHVDGSGNVIVNENFQTNGFKAEIDGSGNILVKNLKATTMDFFIDGSGDIEATGNSDITKAEIDGSGNINLFGLNSRIGFAQIDGSGDIRLSVIEEINSQINGSGSIGYKGNPGKLKTQINGSGSIYKLD